MLFMISSIKLYYYQCRQQRGPTGRLTTGVWRRCSVRSAVVILSVPLIMEAREWTATKMQRLRHGGLSEVEGKRDVNIYALRNMPEAQRYG
jgi:hypothetical protein